MVNGCQGSKIIIFCTIFENRISRPYQREGAGHDPDDKGGRRGARVTVDMEGGGVYIFDSQFRGLEIKDRRSAAEIGDRAQTVAAEYLAKDGQDHAKFAHSFYNDKIQQAIVELCLRRDGEVVAELIAIGHADKERVDGKAVLSVGGSPGPDSGGNGRGGGWKVRDTRAVKGGRRHMRVGQADAETVSAGMKKAGEGDADIGLQPSFLLQRKLMGNLGVETDTAKHTGKMSVDHKAVDWGGLACKDNVQGFRWGGGDMSRKCQTVAGACRNDADTGRGAHEGSGYRTDCAIASADHDIGDLFSFDDGEEVFIIPFHICGKDGKIDFFRIGSPGYQFLEGRLASRPGNGINKINDLSWHNCFIALLKEGAGYPS
jgi:hypothetical protein